MLNPRWLARSILMVIACAPLQAAGAVAPSPEDEVARCLAARQQGCRAEGVVPDGLGGRYNGGSQSCVDGPGVCNPAY